ncbi:MAG: pyruvate dehydrogenase (acetyl-transferring) E1 component subunit alpha [Candidatus Aminicenantales bacterium]
MLFERFDPLRGDRLQILGEDGRVVRSDLEPALSEADLRRMFSLMVLTRTADQKALKLQRQGRFGTYAPSLGHEACQIGAAFGLRREDWVFPYFRDLGLYLTIGFPLASYFHYWMGNEAGLVSPPGLNLYPLAITVAAQLPQAAGAGMAANYLKKPLAVLATCGDGATSEGDFHEGLNFAGVFRTPNVFVCYDNQWAISTPRSRQTASGTLAQKALAYGLPGILVDGNDVLAVYAAVGEGLERARTGKGPALVEALTYRMGHHTTSDDATRYRDEAEVKAWEVRDPLARFRVYLKGKGLWDEALERTVTEKAADDVEAAVAEAEAKPSAGPEDLFAWTFEDMPPRLAGQLAELKDVLGEAGR